MKRLFKNGIYEMSKLVSKTVKAAVYPYRWLIRKQTEAYEKMFGNNLQYVNFWM